MPSLCFFIMADLRMNTGCIIEGYEDKNELTSGKTCSDRYGYGSRSVRWYPSTLFLTSSPFLLSLVYTVETCLLNAQFFFNLIGLLTKPCWLLISWLNYAFAGDLLTLHLQGPWTLAPHLTPYLWAARTTLFQVHLNSCFWPTSPKRLMFYRKGLQPPRENTDILDSF